MVRGSLGPALAALLSWNCAPATAPPERLQHLHDSLLASLGERVRAGDLARGDGYVYGVDVGQGLIAAAQGGDRGLYEELASFVRAAFVLDRPDDPYSRGFVVWRVRAGDAPDASGTTEALRVAEGLWRGAQAFARAEDRDLALVVLDGYARHATVERGTWYVRNYFNLGTRAFATNSFMVDYAPDFVAEVARETGDAALADLAQRSYALIERARTPCGLLYDLVQPELGTLVPEDLEVFSPNDLVQVSNAATVAAEVARGRPSLAHGVLRFALARESGLRLLHLGRSGEAGSSAPPGLGAWAELVRIAARLGDDAALVELLPRLEGAAEALDPSAQDFPWAASEALLALQAALARR